MAMYHFRIKSDKKPDGTRISPVQHVEYIRREGKYEEDKFVGNIISTAEMKNADEGLLYKTDEYGVIRNTAKGIEVTEKASLMTIAVALKLATEKQKNQPLIVSGNVDFVQSVLEAAVRFNLEIKFGNKNMQNEYRRRKEKRDIERWKKKSQSQSQAESPEDKNLEEQLKIVEETVKEILEKEEAKQKVTNAESHVEYINREKAYERRGGCIFHSHKLPKWAKDDPKIFFKMADKYEGVGNRRYVEIEFALPNELKTIEQYQQIIEAFIEKHLKNHYYAYAIHEKTGMLSEEQRHPHVHIMFSERLIDEVEKVKERPAKYFFSYPARKKKDGTEPTFEEKYRRGSLRDRKWCNHQYVCEMREDLAKIENEVLAKNGFSIRVDHRTLKAQKEEAEKKGDTFLARLLNRMPEEYIGIISCKESDDKKLEWLKKFRSLRKQHYDLIFKTDSTTKEIEELEMKDEVQKSLMKARELITSEEFLSQKFDTKEMQELKEKMMFEVEEVNRWKRSIISQHDAEEKAKLEYMTLSEREVWQKYFEMLGQKKQLENFLQTLKKPDVSQKDAIDAYEEMVSGVNYKIAHFLISAASLRESIKEIQKKLETQDCKKNILLVTHKILQSNSYARKMLRLESEKLDRAVDDLKDAIFYQSISDKDYYKTREVYNILRHQYFALKKEQEKTLDLKYSYKRKVISPLRAVAMAKNIFVRGDWKKLCASLHKLHKDSEKLSKNLESFNQREAKFKSTKWTTANQADFLQEKYLLTKEKMALEVERKRLAQLKISLDAKKTELEEMCQKPESVRQIQIIAAGILRKNHKFVDKVVEVDKKLQNISERLKHTKAQIDVTELQLKSEHRTTFYKILEPKYSDKTSASLIADAFLGEPQAVQLVARSTFNNLEMEKTWELMSELDKDEFIHQKIFRDL